MRRTTTTSLLALAVGCATVPTRDLEVEILRYATATFRDLDAIYTDWSERRDGALQALYEHARCGSPERKQPTCDEVARESAHLVDTNHRWALVTATVRTALSARKADRAGSPDALQRAIDDGRRILREVGILR